LRRGRGWRCCGGGGGGACPGEGECERVGRATEGVVRGGGGVGAVGRGRARGVAEEGME